MQTITYSNGVVLAWDDTLCVGELITGYHAGYHILTAIEHRKNQTPIFKYVTVVKEDGTKIKRPGTPKECDAHFCRRVLLSQVEQMYLEEIAAATTKRANLKEFLSGDGK